MARILTDDSWYDEVNLVSYMLESQFELRILQHADLIFKDYIVLPFKKNIESKRSNATPDLILIRNDYSEWWLVEVEKSKHTLDHVLGQVDVFLSGEWNEEELARYVEDKASTYSKAFDKDLFKTLIYNSRPKVMVIVDDHKQEWLPAFSKRKVKLCVIQVFKNESTQELFRINGEYPHIYLSHSKCKFDRKLSRMMRVFDPAILKIKDGEEMDMYDNKMRITRWKRKDYKSIVYLSPIGLPIINPDNDYVIDKDSDGNFHFRIN